MEDKATKGPWDSFGPADRAAMRERAWYYGALAMLAFRVGTTKEPRIRWYPEPGWPE